jgi:glycosyltransferase involved in cell wall biosynthesis
MLERALESIAAQTFDDYEVVVVDDASTDDTSAFLAGRVSERCRVVRNEPNAGVAASRNRGCAVARGEFIAFLDDDDQLRPNALALQREKYLAHPDLDFLWGARLIHVKDATGHCIQTRTDDWTHFADPVRGTAFLPVVLEIAASSAFSVRRTVFEQLGGFDEELLVSEDRDLFLRLAKSGNAGAAVTQTVVDIDEHFGDSLSRSTALRCGPKNDLRVIDKHRAYLELPAHRGFFNQYWLVVFSRFLLAADRKSAIRILGEMRRSGALSRQVLRMYVRHAPEFQVLKSLLRYPSWSLHRRRA